jgi:hypothetical protein
MTTPGYVQVPTDSSGKKIDTDELLRPDPSSTATSAYTTVQRQRITMGDDEDVLLRIEGVLTEIKQQQQELFMILISTLR